MKKILAASVTAFLLASCAPNSNAPSLALDFAPAAPLGARVTGSGSVVGSGSGSSKVRLELRGLPANSSLGAAIYAGSCTNQGHLMASLPDLRTDAGGNATLETNLKSEALPAQGYVNVFQKTQADGYGAALACGNIK